MKLGRIRLGQSGDTAIVREASSVISSYDTLMGRVPLINNADARAQILEWIGRSDVPGSPAERYKVVAEALKSNAMPNELLPDRLEQLRGIVATLDAKVRNFEEAYGTLPAATAAGSTSEADVRGLVFSGSLALLGLWIIPMLLD